MGKLTLTEHTAGSRQIILNCGYINVAIQLKASCSLIPGKHVLGPAMKFLIKLLSLISMRSLITFEEYKKYKS